MGKCVVYIEQSPRSGDCYEAIMALPHESSSVVQAFKTLRFPPNKKGEVTDEDFELLKQHGHIGEGRLLLVEDISRHEADLADQMSSDVPSSGPSQFKNKIEFAIA